MMMGEGYSYRRDVYNAHKEVLCSSDMSIAQKLWTWTNKHYLWTTFILAVTSDFWANWYSYAIVHDWIVLQAFLGVCLPFINFPAMLYFFEHDSTIERFKICAVGAIAMMFGSTAMLLMIRAGIGLGEVLK